MAFVHLHVHSHYSLRKGIASPAALAHAAAQKGMKALALTDQDSLAGMAEHLRACKEHRIKPIVGAELSILFPAVNNNPATVQHLTVLVESEPGYRNLVRLLNAGRRQRTSKIPFAIPLADLITGARGLIVLTGCQAGRLFCSAMGRQVEEALAHIQALVRAAGRGRVFIELLPPVKPADDRINKRLLELAAYSNIPAVVTQNVCYVKKSDHLGEFILRHKDITNENWALWLRTHRTRHFCDETEMRSWFGWQPDLMENTAKIAEMCRFAAPSQAQHFPVQVLPKGDDPEALLWEKSLAALGKRMAGSGESPLKQRLNREISQIRQAKLAPYFLLLHELASELDKAGISRGPAQGIWQLSATAYALGLTPLDPAAFRLPEPDWLGKHESFPLFRFELAESDIPAATELLTRRSGKFMVGRVGRWSVMRRHQLLRQLADQVGVSETRINRLLAEKVKAARPKKNGKSSNGNGNGNGHLEEGLKVEDSTFLRKAADLIADRPQALRADGVMLAFSGQDIEDTVPLAELNDAGLTTQLDDESLDFIGIPRADLTSSSLMTVISWTLRTIREQFDPNFRLQSIPLDDVETYELLSQGKTNCLGELHSIAMKMLLRSAPPKSLLELAALLRRRRKGEADEEGNETAADLSAVLPMALSTYWAAWLKTHYPLAFKSAMLTRNLSNPKRFAILMREANREKIEILPPDLNLSLFHFAPEKGNIRTGLVIVKQLGERAYQELDTERKSRKFDDIVDFCRRMDSKTFTPRLVQNLIKVGAFDRFDLPRAHHLAMLEDIFRDLRAERDQTDDSHQPTLFDMDELEFKRPGSDVRLDEVAEFDPAQLLAYEREAAGYTISSDPFKPYAGLIRSLRARNPFELRRKDIDQEIHVAGFIDHIEWDATSLGVEAAALLDCEGATIRVAKGAQSFIGPTLECDCPALISGKIRRNKEELYLEAASIFSLEEVHRLSREVAQVVVDLDGMDRPKLREISAVLKAYHGPTEVRVKDGKEPSHGFAGLGGGKIDGANVLFCPPVYLALCRLVGIGRIVLTDKESAMVEIQAPAVI